MNLIDYEVSIFIFLELAALRNFMNTLNGVWGPLYLYQLLNKVKGGYTGFTLYVCLPVRCLWTESCLIFIFHNTRRIHLIFTHLINQLQKVCHVLSFVKNSDIFIFGNFFKFASLTLSCVHVMWMLYVDSSSVFLRELLISHDDTSRWFT